MFDLVVCARVFVCLCVPQWNGRVNSVAGWCGTGGNAPLVFEEGGGG